MEEQRRGDWRDDDDRDSWLSDEKYIESVEEAPLVWMKRPVECSRFEVVETPGPALRIAYSTAGTVFGANQSLGDVVVSEGGIVDDEEVISVTVFERLVAGTLPTGHLTSEKLASVTNWVEVTLSEPYSGEKVIDGATGEAMERVDSPQVGTERLQYGRDGCPRWTY